MDIIKLEGTIVKTLPVETKQGKIGEWKKLQFVIETDGNAEGKYKKQICLQLTGENVNKYRLDVGDRIKASVNIQSNEYNGKYYTEITAFKIEEE